MRSKLAAASIALQKLENLKAITKNALKKYGRVPDSLTDALASTQADYAVYLHDLQGRELQGRGLVVCRDAGITLFHASILQQTFVTLKTLDLRASRQRCKTYPLWNGSHSKALSKKQGGWFST